MLNSYCFNIIKKLQTDLFGNGVLKRRNFLRRFSKGRLFYLGLLLRGICGDRIM
jgi:hypothetical protein